MFQHKGKLEPALAPDDYSSAEFFEREREAVFGESWNFVGLRDELARPGDFVAVDVAGVPVVCRNVDGTLRAFKNVCLHRHCAILPAGAGHQETLRCQYHGWEYGPEGNVSKLPDGQSFKGLRVKGMCLDRFRVETLGALVFVNLSPSAPGLRDAIGELAEEIDYFFGAHSLVWRWTVEYPVNWKIVAENAVESYHVPLVHPTTFADYKPEEHHDHRLDPAYTSYLDVAPMGASFVETALKTMTRVTTRDVRFERAKHTHIFPNHMFDYREICSLFAEVVPLGPERTRMVSIGFVPRRVRFPIVSHAAQRMFRVSLRRMARKIMLEDVGIWSEVQRGMKHSAVSGVLSRREERVYAFQRFVRDAVEGDGERAATGGASPAASARADDLVETIDASLD